MHLPYLLLKILHLAFEGYMQRFLILAIFYQNGGELWNQLFCDTMADFWHQPFSGRNVWNRFQIRHRHHTMSVEKGCSCSHLSGINRQQPELRMESGPALPAVPQCRAHYYQQRIYHCLSASIPYSNLSSYTGAVLFLYYITGSITSVIIPDPLVLNKALNVLLLALQQRGASWGLQLQAI